MTLLSVEEVSVRFGGLSALTRVSVNVSAGEIVSLIGPNGAGKTTLMNVITRVLKPNTGKVFFNGERIDGLSTHQIVKKGIARTFQLVRLFKGLSVLENVMIGEHVHTTAEALPVIFRSPHSVQEERESQKYAMEMLEFVNLVPKADRTVTELSHGEQRLVELARALASKPKCLLLDEPSCGLNPQETQTLESMIRTIQRSGVATLLVAHDMHMVMTISNRITVLNFGQKIAEGTPDAIAKDPIVIQAYLGESYASA